MTTDVLDARSPLTGSRTAGHPLPADRLIVGAPTGG